MPVAGFQKWLARARTPIGLGTALLAVASVVLLVNLIGLFLSLNERSRTAKEAAREDTVWATYQLANEAATLLDLLEAAAQGTAAVPDLTQRYDILYSRTGLLTQGQLGKRFGEDETLSALVAEMRNDIVALAPDFDAMDSSGTIEAVRLPGLISGVTDVDQHASDLVIATNARNNEVKVAEREAVNTLYVQMAGNVGGLTVVFGAFVMLLAAQLRHIAKLGAASRLAAEEAQRTNRAKSAFLATMSHEIRTPLNGIIGMTELMGDGILIADQRSRLGIIRQSGDVLLDVINDILDFSKLESGSVELAVTTFHLDEVVQSVQQILAPRAAARKLELVVDMPDAMIATDPARLRQILINIVGNAIKFTERGKVSVTGRVLQRGDSSVLQVCVADTGIGMSAETLSHLFEEFTQGDPSISRRFGGTGLGLAICKRLATALGGSITATSTPGQGSRFVIELPCRIVAETPSAVAPLARAPEASPVAGLHVLLVEDNHVNQQVATGLLQNMGAEVTLATNGQLALDAVSHRAFDLVLMDMQMPVMDGLTATRLLRQS
ncbi:MAG: ATP-binding protein, partial [Devosia sp.]